MVLVFLDVETTGLDSDNDSIFQIAGIIRGNGREESFNYNLKPYKNTQITLNAYSKTGVTQEQLDSFPNQRLAYEKFITLLKQFNVGSSYENKAYFIGYNSDFDMRFMRSWFEFNNNKRFGYYFLWPDLDVARLAAFILAPHRNELTKFTLASVYRYLFNKDFENAHDALADIQATREIFNEISKRMLVIPNAQQEK